MGVSMSALSEILGLMVPTRLMGPTGTGKSLVHVFVGLLQSYHEDDLLVYQHTDGTNLLHTSMIQLTLAPKKFKSSHVYTLMVLDEGSFSLILSDYEILTIITQQLTESRRIILSGIIQFCSIADAKMCGTPLINLKIFEQLCGPNVLKNVILTATFWDQVNTDIGSKCKARLDQSFGRE
ncbi:uncharacterized protein LACBIDRAFT_329356 [Laccaria bicolor S238N-H82]|uniref:Predicted protein n=1 Tax=Laccaria bicolor (strain S238N-H82 / ATCC MYA-4686) TaxID=486041 RepID=B0DHS8_LACBS|nr:uncharacterized protein LACBIDRAFT_329356 [Laccaria bicolor S238N-H82]EDR05782.1 predicted protein [Laccaria bicolor S238N-H82]|eukprot:XP_001883458.1 predicted protein [Laccaria bicolor S238N-H82]